ncbi:MAG TPA: hypothetical protein PLE99_05875 [Candidatus Thiothrix moscowensis]|uniref:hypothetical protein n=1 Tax=unclassified Thiothrix TaxID=2636184 RepID=UPI0025F6C8DA|nr:MULTISPECIES: hypothetical protein [unclassified Thiothrix]HRJ52273.1 hypothetical protein [Candidatus Thiothrix moscowensis]HRJ92588.1 hypothetical protein [Candidatus Thiothrix moscowensis]
MDTMEQPSQTVQSANSVLEGISQQDVLLAAALMLVFAVGAGIWHYRKQQAVLPAIGVASHIAVWEASSGANMLFWYILGSSMDAVSAVLLPIIFFVADIAKVLIPRTRKYRQSWDKRISVNILRGFSLFATIGLGSLYATQNANSGMDAELARQQAAFVVKAAEASVDAADTRLESNAPDADDLALQQSLRDKINAIQNRPAVNASGIRIYLDGKDKPATTVWVATKGCSTKSSYSKVPANGCEELSQLQLNLAKWSSGLASQAKNMASQSESYKNAGQQLEEARRTLQGTPPALPVNDMIAAAQVWLGYTQEQASDHKRNSLIFGALLAISLELLVMMTINLDFKNTSAKDDDVDSSGASWVAATTGLGLLLFKTAQNRLFSRAKRGLDAGQFPLHGQESLAKTEKPLASIPVDEVEQFKQAVLSTLNDWIDLSVIRDEDGFKIKEGHQQALVLLMQNFGGNVSNDFFFNKIRNAHGEGIRKAYISESKLILYRNGYMWSKPFGNRGVTYEWVDEDTLRNVMRQHLAGTYHYQPDTKPASTPEKAGVVSLAERRNARQQEINLDGLTAA